MTFYNFKIIELSSVGIGVDSLVRKERPRTTVVLDGSNIVSGGWRAFDQQVNGHRLISAIDLYQSKGYEVIPCMKGTTFFYMSGDYVDYGSGKKVPKSPGYDALNRITEIDSETRLRFYKKDDDLHIIHLALEKNAWIVTNDTFEDKRNRDTGEITPRERSNYPELDWQKIDEMTWGTNPTNRGVKSDDTWRTEESAFLHPTLKPAPAVVLTDENSELRDLLGELDFILGEIDKITESHQNPELEYVREIRHHVGYQHIRFRKMLEVLPKPTIPTEDELRSMTVEVLKEICRNLELKVSGLKEELVKRIVESSDNHESSSGEEIEDALEADKQESDDIIGFTKEEFVEALLSSKTKNGREAYGTIYSRLINENPRFNLKKYEIKPTWYLEECSGLINFEIRVSGMHNHYWI